MTDEEAIKEFLIQGYKAGIDKFYEEILEKLKFVKNDKKECQEMTDKEIIKALECCVESECEGCKYEYDTACKEYILHDCIRLINRQQAEIERLNKEVDRLSQCVLYHEGQIVDAVKDFAERLKDYLRQQPQWYVIRENYKNVGFSYDDVFFGIEKVVKEMTEGE